MIDLFRQMRKSYCGLFCVLVMLLVAHYLLPVQMDRVESGEVCATLTTADHERDWFKERTTHTALLPEIHIHTAPISRTTIGRQRTLAKPAHHLVALKVVTGLGMAQPFATKPLTMGNSSLAKYYYIYALRHIII